MKPRILWCNECSVLKTGYATYGREILNRLHATNKYTLAEHAVYIHRSDPRIQKLPWTVYANLPDQDNEQQVQEYNSKPGNQFGEWRFEEICCDFKPHIVMDVRDFWMCVVKGTNIVTKSYVKNIEHIKIGDEVLTHKGQYKKVQQVFKRNTFEQINVIKASHYPFEVALTNDHPVLLIPFEKRSSYNFPKKEPEWINAKQIKKFDLVAYPIDSFGKNKLPLDKCRLIGYYTAEGCLMYEGLKKDGKLKGIQLTMNANEKTYIEDIKKIVKQYYNREVKVKIKGNAAILRIFNKKIAVDMKKYASSLAENKQWSDFIFHMNRDCCKHLLCGLFRGDGGYYENRASYCTKSKQLAHQVFRMCLRFDMLPSFNLNNNTCNGKTFQRYIFSFSSNSNLNNFINIYELLSTATKKSKRIINNYAWLTIRDVYKYTRSEKVYNLKVEDDESYVSSFAVHNCSHAYRSPFRPYYNLILMPTVDAFPQNQEWLSTYSDADGIFTYQDWSKQVLDYEGGGKIKTLGSASPAADDAFRPLDKQAIKKEWGFENKQIIGTTMRNQRRKLFPDLFASFRIFLNETGRDDIILHCHTSYPDMGWRLPDLLLRYGLTSKVTFTYKCKNCKYVFPDYFHDIIYSCPRCGKMSASFVSVQDGATSEELSKIYNLYDLYIQYANSEGFGLPQLEAAACGIPVMSVDYSAMTDAVRKLEGKPIPLLGLSLELETGCFRAIPNNEIFISMLKEFFELDYDKRLEIAQKTFQAYHKHYSWGKTAQKWMNYFDNVDVDEYEKRWKSPPQYIEIPNDYPKNVSNKDFARWLIFTFLHEQRFFNSYMEARLIRDLNYGVTAPGLSGMYFNDDSASPMFHKPHWTEFNREIAVRHFSELAKRKNYWEKKRWQSIQTKQ